MDVESNFFRTGCHPSSVFRTKQNLICFLFFSSAAPQAFLPPRICCWKHEYIYSLSDFLSFFNVLFFYFVVCKLTVTQTLQMKKKNVEANTFWANIRNKKQKEKRTHLMKICFLGKWAYSLFLFFIFNPFLIFDKTMRIQILNKIVRILNAARFLRTAIFSNFR